MIKLWNWFVEWLTSPQREMYNAIVELVKVEMRTEQLKKQQEQEDSEAYRDFLEDTAEDAEYNAYIEHMHSPRAEDY